MKNTVSSTVQKILWIGKVQLPAIHEKIAEAICVHYCDCLEYRRATEEIRPDLIIIDHELSHPEVLNIVESIRLHEASAHTMLMLLAESTFHELEYVLAGVDHFLIVPVRPDILSARIKTILESRRRLQLHFRKQAGLPDDNTPVADPDQGLLARATRIVETNLDNTSFNVQSLVNEMHMSQSVLYRRLKETTGESVIDFIKKIRLKKAAQLLRQPQVRVSEVAFLVGIEDPKNFRTSFKRMYNISPSQYARFYGQN